MELNQICSFKKPKINPSQWQSAPWGAQRSEAKCLYKMFIFGGLCGLVFGRALTRTRLSRAGNRRQEAESWPLPAPPLHTRVDCGLLCSQGRQLVLFLPWHLLRTLVTSAETSPSAPPGPDPPLSTHFSVSESTAEPSSSKAIFHFCSLPVLRSSFLRLHSQYPCPNTAVLSSLGHKTQGSSWPQLSS